MGGLLDLISGEIGKNLISNASKQLGQKEDKTSSAIAMAIPLILGAMKNNSSNSSGAKGLLGALSNSSHDGGILDNLGGFIGKSTVQKDGANILGHIFGGKQKNVAKAVSAKSGMDLSAVSKLLQMLAPVVMGYLGKQSRNKNITDENGIGDLLGNLLGGKAKNEQSLVSKILDADGDGSVIDDLVGMASGDKKGKLGGLLGGIFGK